MLGPLDEPALRGLTPESPEWFHVQRTLIDQRPLIRDAYQEWYTHMLSDARSVPAEGRIVELGSGSNYVKSLDSTVVTSDVFAGLSDLVVDARSLPFEAESVRALLLTHVFHHIPNVEEFLEEAVRTLVPGGVISLIDVAPTPFGRFFFSRCHPEAFDAGQPSWGFDPESVKGHANQALSWIVLVRDRAEFARRFPRLMIEEIDYLPWLGYFLSGGLTRRSLLPSAATGIVRLADRASRPLDRLMALHWHIRIRKRA